MKYFISQIRINGIKNIDKEIEISFLDKTIKKPFSIKNSNIKALYGENGAGKSGVIHAIKIYNDLLSSNNYLYESKNKSYVKELTNNISKKLYFCIDFIQYDYKENEKEVYRKFTHSILLNTDKSNEVSIESEYIKAYKLGKYKDNQAIEFFRSENGQIVISKFSDYLNESSKNKLNRESILTIFNDTLLKELTNEFIKSNKEKEDSVIHKYLEKYENDFFVLNSIRVFNSNLNVYMNESDDHTYFLNVSQNKDRIHIPMENGEILIDKTKIDNFEEFSLAKFPKSQYSKIVSKSEKKEYISQVKKLESFIKIFKNNLLEIDIDFRQFLDSSMLIAKLILKYKNGNNVALEFESTGIKKLVSLYDAFSKIDAGEIVVIDEFDANLHDVYLLKIIEYFSQYGKGQLFFTTHNLGPMEILKDMKHSIDFLSNDSRISTWKRNGNYSIVKLFRKGLIQNLPFNIETTDFIGIFDNSGDSDDESE